MKKNVAIAVCALLLASCAGFHAERMGRIGLGMSREDVIRTLGKPESVGGGKRVEVLHYAENTGWWVYDYYFVRLVGGKVESFGIERKDDQVTETDPPLKTQP